MKSTDLSPDRGEAVRYWKAFGIDPTYDKESKELVGPLPVGVIAFYAYGRKQMDAQEKALRKIAIPPAIWANVGKRQQIAFYELGNEITLEQVKKHFDRICSVYGEGDYISLPFGDDFTPDEWPETADELSVFDTLEAAVIPQNEGPSDDLPQQISGGTILDKFSVRDADLGDPVFSQFLLGKTILTGQATVIYAPPNSGKTLLTLSLLDEAVLAARLSPARCYYVNADDSPEGVHTKRSILAETGIHMLVPGLQGFDAIQLLKSIEQLIEDRDCEGVFVIVDTLKKFVDLMDKKQTSSFGDLVRRFVLQGGTFLALAHTRKNEGADGQLVYGGTSDVVEDFDAACLLVPLPERTERNEKLVQFQFRKRRGCNVEEIYAYDDDPELSYDVRLASVRLVDGGEVACRVAHEKHRSDGELIEALRTEIEAGNTQKMALVNAVSSKTKASRRSVMAVLERYTGDDPNEHHWTFSVQARGAKVYRLHSRARPE